MKLNLINDYNEHKDSKDKEVFESKQRLKTMEFEKQSVEAAAKKRELELLA